VKETTTTTGKPLLDADSFQKLLAAAYVLQEHRDDGQAMESAPASGNTSTNGSEAVEILDTKHLSEASAPPDYNQTLAEIVATQQQIHRSQMNLQDAINLIADRTRQIARASGAAIVLLQNHKLVYRAASGTAATLLRSEMQVDSCLASHTLASGESFHCANATTGSNAGFCRRYGIKAFTTVPVFYEGKVAGAIELHAASANGFREPDIRTCQLMAGLVTEAMARAAEVEWKQTLAAERATMLHALDQLKPQLQRLAAETDSQPSNYSESVSVSGAAAAPATDAAILCVQCGSPLEAEQLFCGECGAEQPATTGDLQSKWASMWDLSHSSPVQRPLEPLQTAVAEESNTSENASTPAATDDWEAAFVSEATPAPSEAVEALTAPTSSLPAIAQPAMLSKAADLPEIHTGTALAEKSYPWTSAAKARKWLDAQRNSDAASRLIHLWTTRRADVYLGVAILLGVVAIPWMMWSRPAETPTASNAAVASAPSSNGRTAARRRKPAAPKLTMFEQLLVSLGLAEPPPTPTYMGNPDTQVWEDLHTAMYYCPGAELYGKTEKGKFTTQRDAQLDQFEPAFREACD
jgi:GAF domain-containing protein